jgi:membrane-bound lytic murein transglycosylase D
MIPRLPMMRSALFVGVGAALVSCAGVGVGLMVDRDATLTAGFADLATNRATDAEPTGAPPPAPPAEMPEACPLASPVDPPWMGVAPVAPAQAPVTPASLQRRVKFWTHVWGDIGDNVHLLVDDRRPWLVHAEVDCRDLFVAGVSAEAAPVEVARAKASCGARLSDQRRAVQQRLKKTWMKGEVLRRFDGDKKLARTAHEHLVAIQGRKDALTRAKDRASPHLGHAEGLFALADVPRIYARAAIVESLWRPEALSRSGAAGAYQFMPRTGAQYLMVDEGVVDERLDPLRSSWAAARYMRDIERQLDSWPLVLTAYNTGPARLKRVMKARKSSDLGRIADAGDFGEFGFDGQNYYAQIAAIGRLTVHEPFDPKPVTGRAVKLEQPVRFATLARCQDIQATVLARANPALHADVIDGRTAVPKGYVAYIPDAQARTALNLVTVQPATQPTTQQTTQPAVARP